MHPEQVELIAARLRRDGKVQFRDNKTQSRDSVLRHLDSARARLNELRETRQQMAATLSRCVDERDAAIAALNKLKETRNEQAKAVYHVQQAIIEDLRKDLELAISALQEVDGMLEVGRFSPNIFTRASTSTKTALDQLSRRYSLEHSPE